jgi:HPt (histidine-containing phosphotransfer) domain-containing protein
MSEYGAKRPNHDILHAQGRDARTSFVIRARGSRMADVPHDATASLDLLRSVGGDEMLAMMLRTFIEFADERIPAMATEVAGGRLREAAAIAHSIKSSARQLGAMALGDDCQHMEEAGKAENAAAAADGVLRVQDSYRAAREWMLTIATAS